MFQEIDETFCDTPREMCGIVFSMYYIVYTDLVL